jgi:hypothetical protein
VQPQLSRTEAFGLFDPLPRIIDVHVEVQSVLNPLGLGHPLQVEYRKAGRRVEVNPPRVDLTDDFVPEESSPEVGGLPRVDHVDTNFDGANRLHCNDRTCRHPEHLARMCRSRRS